MAGQGLQDRRTPPWLLQAIEKYMGARFTLDAAADSHNAVCRRFYDKQANGLVKPWAKYTYANPPFGEPDIGPWLRKAIMEAEDRGVTSAVVGPVGCSQLWFHKFARLGTILVPTSRIAYLDPAGNPTPGAKQDTMVYLFGPRWLHPDDPSFRVMSFNITGLVVKKRRSRS